MILIDNKISEWTPVKRAEVRRMMGKSYGVIGNEYRNTGRRFPYVAIYVDLNAGDGGNPASPSSCLSALQILRDQHDKVGLPYKLYLYEKHKGRAQLLQSLLDSEHIYEEPARCSVQLFAEDNQAAIHLDIPKHTMGIVYADPHGGCEWIPIFIELSKKEEYQRVDFLANIACTSIKRVNGAFHRCETCSCGERLSNCLRRINKKYFKIRRPQTGQQWVLALLTNASGKIFDRKSDSKHDWYTTEESWERIDEIALTAKEKEEANGNGD